MLHSDTEAFDQIPMMEDRRVLEAMASRLEGLTKQEVIQNLDRFGRNAVPGLKRKSLIKRFLANFTHLMAFLLWGGGVIGFVAGMPQLGYAIWAVNLINGIFSFWQEYKAEKATETLLRLLPAFARIVREGREVRVLAEELVPGDILLLAEGEKIPADARLLSGSALTVDQSTLTGESRPVQKTGDVAHPHQDRWEYPNLIFAGTSVATGSARAVVIATGGDTEFGKIARLTQALPEAPSPLQKEMMWVTRLITLLVVAIGAVFWAAATLLAGLELRVGFVFAMGMIVAFVPEGLLPTVTLSLAMGVQRMARRNALVKTLSSVETLGSTTVICTDKTGTLTQNEMTVTDFWVGGRKLKLTGVGYHSDGQVLEAGRPVSVHFQPDLQELLTAASLCNNSRLVSSGSVPGVWTPVGESGEAALRVAALKAGLNGEEIERLYPRISEIPFDTRRRRMTTIQQGPEERIVFVKGSAKELLTLCTRFRQGGAEITLDEKTRREISDAVDGYARGGLRVLAFARRTLPGSLSDFTPYQMERELTFLGLAALTDPPRAGVAEAVEKCHRAGIRLVMFTGDYELTAEAVARKIGLLRSSRSRIYTGGEVAEMSDAELAEVLRANVVFARFTPEEKLRLVAILQTMGEVVAVTGDGVNDAPALKKADIGVAMGKSGTDVAREAADMVLVDDDFASIVNAVEEGRAVYANIRKFITYIFTSNVAEAFPFIFFALSSGRIPLGLNVMQVLSIDLGTDIMPALALGAEKPESGLMDRPPRPRNQHVIDKPLLIRVFFWLGLFQGITAMVAFYFQYWRNGFVGQWIDLPSGGTLYASATTMTLAAIVASQVGNLFTQRSERLSLFRMNPFTNRLLWLGVGVEVVLLLAVVYLPPFQKVFGTAPFAAANWFLLLAAVPLLPLADEVRKAVARRKTKSRGNESLH
ncbi:MAG TPA: cation-transporting P-type ATPase [Verrucomicrobiae bacterium]|nr:cation-transporting P-type ATPase [Verrucomicrobiae bacterium]